MDYVFWLLLLMRSPWTNIGKWVGLEAMDDLGLGTTAAAAADDVDDGDEVNGPRDSICQKHSQTT
jgi:hypothetical protein